MISQIMVSYSLSLQDEVKSWVKFASICRKSGKMALSERTLLSLLTSDPACSHGQLISEKYPQVHPLLKCLNFINVLRSSSLFPRPRMTREMKPGNEANIFFLLSLLLRLESCAHTHTHTHTHTHAYTHTHTRTSINF